MSTWESSVFKKSLRHQITIRHNKLKKDRTDIGQNIGTNKDLQNIGTNKDL